MHLETIARSVDPWFLNPEVAKAVSKQVENTSTLFFDWATVQQLVVELKPEPAQHDPKKQVKLWSSEAFFTTTPQEFGFEQSRIELDLGIRTFFDEYALLNPRKKYTEYGNKGWKNQNSVRTKISCERFVESLKRQKKNHIRAELEVWAANTYEQFLNDSSIEPGSVLIMISPRGSVEEGYPGEDPSNYFFINVYIKENNTYSTLHQFTSYALMPQLLETHKSLSSQESTQSSSATSTEKFLTTLPNAFSQERIGKAIPDSHWVITNPILIKPQDTSLSPEQTLAFIDQELYKNQDGWDVCIADLPEIDMDLYTKKSEELITQILIIFDELVHLKLGFDIDVASLIADFDSLISLSRRYLLKWVEQNARNYEQNYSEAEKQAYPDVNSFIQSWKETSFVYSNTNAWSQNKTIKSTTIYSATSGRGSGGSYVGNNSSKTNTASLESGFQLSSSTLTKVSSAAHCVVGTPGATAIQAQNSSLQSSQSGKESMAKKTNTNDTQTKTNLSQKTQQQKSSLSHKQQLNENKALIKRSVEATNSENSHPEQMQRIRSLQNKYIELERIQENVVPIVIENNQTQKQEIIYIWFLDPSLAQQYEPGCYRNNAGGVVFGPCHVDLEDDELLASFEFSGNYKRYLGQAEYSELSEQLFELQMLLILETSLLTDENLNGNSGNASSQYNQLDNDSLTKEEQEKSLKVVATLSKKIFRVTFSDLVAGFAGTPILSYTQDVFAIPQKCSEFLANYGPNKIEGVRELISILEEDEITVIMNKLQVSN